MAGCLDKISSVKLNRECIRLKVRVVRMWTVPMFNNPNQPSSLELILVDGYGGKIQATIRKPLLHRFTPLLEKGCVYKMVYFNVVPNSGHYRATFHDLKLIFLSKTTVVKKPDDSIPMFGFSFVPFKDVLSYNDNYDHLIDVMGVLTGVFPERQYEKGGKMTTMVVMELTDPHGKLECALFGEYVNDLRNFLQRGDNVQVIVVVQLAREKTFRGKTVIQNSMNATKLFFNPDILEAITFRNRFVKFRQIHAEHGVIDVEPLAIVLDNSREGLESDFMTLHPKKSISELTQIQEDGVFVVLASIVDIVNDGPWFYLACKCNRSVTLQSTVHFCENCQVPVLQVSPRFKVKVEVSDEKDTVVFVLFDRDMGMLIKKTCEELLTHKLEDVTVDGYPSVFDTLIGQRLLFKVETKVAQIRQFEGSYPVRRICTDKDVIGMFDLAGADLTPTKAIFAPPFPIISNDIGEVEAPFHQIDSGIPVTPIALGDDEFALGIKCTPAKRKLDVEFASCQVDAKCTRVKMDVVVEVVEVDEEEPVCALVPVKIEKD